MRASKQLIEDLVTHYIYQHPSGNPDWGALQIALGDYGFTSGQVFEILNDVRQGGTGDVQFLTEG